MASARTPLLGAQALACALFAAQAGAQPLAVGRLSYGAGDRPGAPICTATLIAPDLVLTAAHCLPAAARSNPASVHFVPGWGTDSPGPERQGAEVKDPPARQADGISPLAGDLALLRLNTAIPPDQVAPLPLANGVPSGPFLFFGYDRAKPDLAPASQTCRALAQFPMQGPQVVGLDCAVVSGNSGGPLLVQTSAGNWQIAAVMVARGRAPLVSLAVLPPPDLLP